MAWKPADAFWESAQLAQACQGPVTWMRQHDCRTLRHTQWRVRLGWSNQKAIVSVPIDMPEDV
eukprot:86242-Amphidinium_carterae.1